MTCISSCTYVIILSIPIYKKKNYLFIRYLYKNKIENIESRVFNNLTNLEQLYLHFNKIHKLDLEMFKGLTKLDRL